MSIVGPIETVPQPVRGFEVIIFSCVVKSLVMYVDSKDLNFGHVAFGSDTNVYYRCHQ